MSGKTFRDTLRVEHGTLWSAFIPGAAIDGLTLQQRLIGELRLPSGLVVAGDPAVDLVPPQQPDPFEFALSPGSYQVILGIAMSRRDGDQRVAAAMVQCTTKPPMRWEAAVTARTRLEAQKATRPTGFGVDSAHACFTSLEAAVRLCQRESLVDVGERLERKTTYEWGEVEIPESGGLNLFVFSSGLGDGNYPSFWGFSENGAVSCLVTDFCLLGNARWSADRKSSLIKRVFRRR